MIVMDESIFLRDLALLYYARHVIQSSTAGV